MDQPQTNHFGIRIEGWRGISHSYALVNQFQLLHWKKSATAKIEHVDMPFIMAHWSKTQNSAGFSEIDQNIIENISEPIEAKALYRIFAPFGLDTPLELPTVTFAVTEFGLNSEKYNQSQVDKYAALGGKIHTPSHWSKKRLMASGIPEAIIYVIPHASDNDYFYPMHTEAIQQNRKTLGFQDDDVVLLNVGTHHWNKGLDASLTAFAKARKKNRKLKFLLKDQRSTYLMNSDDYVQQILNNIGINDAETFDSIRLLSGHLDLSQLNAIYNVADAYLTPYRAEGFNLPALEAQACGTPVIATLGGATDDFLDTSKNAFVSGKLIENAKIKDDLEINAYIEPNQDDLIHILEKLERITLRAKTPNQFSWLSACTEIKNLYFSS